MDYEIRPAQRSSGRELVERLIPHREPFLLIDRVLARDADSITVERDVRPDEPVFAGHYPGFPVFPGVLSAEVCFQASAALFGDPDRPATFEDKVPVVTKIEAARFRHMVRPGETLRAEVEVEERLANARYMKARVSSGGRTVLTMRFVVAETPLTAREEGE